MADTTNTADVSSQSFSHPHMGEEFIQDPEIMIPVKSDRIHEMLARNINYKEPKEGIFSARALAFRSLRNLELKEDINFAARIGFKIIVHTPKDPDHLWSFYRNYNEVKPDKDDKSRVLFDKPIVWSVKQLVLKMDQMLTDPGI